MIDFPEFGERVAVLPPGLTREVIERRHAATVKAIRDGDKPARRLRCWLDQAAVWHS